MMLLPFVSLIAPSGPGPEPEIVHLLSPESRGDLAWLACHTAAFATSAGCAQTLEHASRMTDATIRAAQKMRRYLARNVVMDRVDADTVDNA